MKRKPHVWVVEIMEDRNKSYRPVEIVNSVAHGEQWIEAMKERCRNNSELRRRQYRVARYVREEA